MVPTIPPSVHERFLQVRIRRQERLAGEPVLRLSTVIDEAVLLRRIGDHAVMRAQLQRLSDAAQSPNVDLRILPLRQHPGLVTGSFVIMRFGAPGEGQPDLGDVVSTEVLATETYVEGETDTRLYSIFFDSLQSAALSPAVSRQLVAETLVREWS